MAYEVCHQVKAARPITIARLFFSISDSLPVRGTPGHRYNLVSVSWDGFLESFDDGYDIPESKRRQYNPPGRRRPNIYDYSREVKVGDLLFGQLPSPTTRNLLSGISFFFTASRRPDLTFLLHVHWRGRIPFPGSRWIAKRQG